LYRFIAILPDSSTRVARTAEYALVTVLPRKHPNLLFNHFMETIFVLNRCNSHPNFNKILDHEKFTFPGEGKNERKRHYIYKFLLTHLTLDQRLKIHGRLHTEVLAMHAEGKVEFDKFVISDVLAILSAREMRFTKQALEESSKNLKSEDAEMKEEAKTVLMEKVIKKHVQENVIPIIIELKRVL